MQPVGYCGAAETVRCLVSSQEPRTCRAPASRRTGSGGYSRDPVVNWDDTWFSSDGRGWSDLDVTATCPGRHEQSTWVRGDRLWIADGFAGPLVNDVWSLQRDPAMAERMTQLGMVVQEDGTPHYRQFMLDDLERCAGAVRKLNLQIR